jgi:hypothetical protein
MIVRMVSSFFIVKKALSNYHTYKIANKVLFLT